MQETEVTVFIYSQEPFEAHIFCRSFGEWINQTNVLNFQWSMKKPQKV